MSPQQTKAISPDSLFPHRSNVRRVKLRGLDAELASRTALCASADARVIWHLPQGVRPVPVVR